MSGLIHPQCVLMMMRRPQVPRASIMRLILFTVRWRRNEGWAVCGFTSLTIRRGGSGRTPAWLTRRGCRSGSWRHSMGFPECGDCGKTRWTRLFQGEVWASPHFFCVLQGNFVQDDLHGVKWCGTLCCTAMRQWPNGRAPDSHSGDCGFESRLPLCCDMVYMCATISSAVCSGHICGSGLIW